MKITYNIKGQERKNLVAAISQEMILPAKYLGMPSASYEIGRLTVDKNGTLTGPDYRDLVADLQGLHGFIPTSVEYDDADYTPAWHDTSDREDRDEDGNWDGSETPYYREPRYTEEELGLGVKRTDSIGEDGMRESDIPDEDETYRLVIEIPLTGFTPEKLDNLTKLVNSKGPLLKAPLGVDELPIQIGEETIKFPWLSGELDAEHIKAYTALISMLCKTAKGKKHVTSKEKEITGSPKYAMHCFLISIGAIGPEHKQMRKILQSKLSGSSAFKAIEG